MTKPSLPMAIVAVVGLGLVLLGSSPASAQSDWTMQQSGTTEHLNGVSFADASSGWAAGDGSTILHTADGGVTWAPQDPGVLAIFMAVSFHDTQNGMAVGSELSVDTSKLDEKQKARIRELLYNQRARPAPEGGLR